MVSMSGSGAGYLDETIITPYMHILVLNAPTMMRMYGSLKKFCGKVLFHFFLFLLSQI